MPKRQVQIAQVKAIRITDDFILYFLIRRRELDDAGPTMFENAVTIPSELKEILVAVPKTLSGAIRFKGTRVPVHALIDTLDAGQGIEGFLDSWPNVPRGQAEAVIHWEQNVSCQPLGLDLVAGCG